MINLFSFPRSDMFQQGKAMCASKTGLITIFAAIMCVSCVAFAEYQCKAQIPGASTVVTFDVKQARTLGFSLGDFDFSAEPINISIPSAADSKGIAITISGHGMKMTAVGPEDTPFLGVRSETSQVQFSCRRETH